MSKKIKNLFNHHFEWTALAAGLLLMGFMNPYVDQGTSWCLFEQVGISFCPGEGLGHSIAFIFRGDFYNAMQANVIGPFAVVVILSRIAVLLNDNIIRNSLFNNLKR